MSLSMDASQKKFGAKKTLERSLQLLKRYVRHHLPLESASTCFWVVKSTLNQKKQTVNNNYYYKYNCIIGKTKLLIIIIILITQEVTIKKCIIGDNSTTENNC